MTKLLIENRSIDRSSPFQPSFRLYMLYQFIPLLQLLVLFCTRYLIHIYIYLYRPSHQPIPRVDVTKERKESQSARKIQYKQYDPNVLLVYCHVSLVCYINRTITPGSCIKEGKEQYAEKVSKKRKEKEERNEEKQG